VGVQEASREFADATIRYSVYGYPEVVYDPAPYHTADFNGDVGTDADFAAIYACMSGDCCPRCIGREIIDICAQRACAQSTPCRVRGVGPCVPGVALCRCAAALHPRLLKTSPTG
jgi:hypothetical protein